MCPWRVESEGEKMFWGEGSDGAQLKLREVSITSKASLEQERPKA